MVIKCSSIYAVIIRLTAVRIGAMHDFRSFATHYSCLLLISA